MTFKQLVLGSTALCASVLTLSAPVDASSHRESPNITKMPKVDNTDVYAFRSYEPGRDAFTTIIANFQPGENPGDGPNYYTMDPDALYEIHIDNTGDAIEDLTYQFKFNNVLKGDKGKTLNVGGKDLPIALRHIGPIAAPGDPNLGEDENYTVTLITGDRRTGTRAPIANAAGGATSFVKPFDNAGNKSIPGGYETYARKFLYEVNIPGCTVAARVFVGQRAEYFAVNLGPIFDLVNLVPIQGAADPVYSSGAPFPGGITQSQDNQELIGKKNVT